MMETFVKTINRTIETKLQAMQNELFEMAKEHQNVIKENVSLKKKIKSLSDHLEIVSKQNVVMEAQIGEVKQYSRRDRLMIHR